jgi:DhnA family fructose-bisphosphate aldolase class Ia
MGRKSGKTVIFPMGHGATIGPTAGLVNMQKTINAVAMSGANAIVIRKGLVETGQRRKGKDLGLIIQSRIRLRFDRVRNIRCILNPVRRICVRHF